MDKLEKALNDLRDAFMEAVKPLGIWLLDRPLLVAVSVVILLILMAVDILL